MEKLYDLQKDTYCKVLNEIFIGNLEGLRFRQEDDFGRTNIKVIQKMRSIGMLKEKLSKYKENKINSFTKEDIENIKNFITNTKMVKATYKKELLEFIELLEKEIK